MDTGHDELPAQDIGADRTNAASPGGRTSSSAPSWRGLLAMGLAIAALIGVYGLGRSDEPSAVAAPIGPAPTARPTAAATAEVTPEPADAVEEAPATTSDDSLARPSIPAVVDALGEGLLLADFDLGDGSRAMIWCRESVPGTQIASTLALIHVASSARFGDQVVLYEELTKPWLPSGPSRRGRVLQTEGLGATNRAASAPLDDGADLERSDGSRCRSCAPAQVTLAGADILVGSCIHGIPFGVGIVYVIAPAVLPGQTPLALHVSCGITTVRVDGDQLVIAGEAPLVRGLQDARFELPAISFERVDGEFVASDLGLLDWNCDVERSSHLAGRYRLRTEPARSIWFRTITSAIGEIGVHGPMVLGLTTEQCSELTNAWWGQPSLDSPTGSPIADLVDLDPPPGERDWFYSCHRS